jgi:hypothetical protein
MRSVSGVGRFAAIAAVVIAVAVVGYLPLGTSSYKVTAEFENAGQLVKGNPVQIGGVAVGTVSDIEIAPNGHVLIAMTLKGPQTRSRRARKAEIRQLSLSSIAGRYVELEQPSEPIAQRDESTIPEGGKIPISQTVTAVDLDQVFNVLGPVARVAIQDFIKDSATKWKGKGAEAQPRPPVPQPVALDHAPALRRARIRQAAAAPLRHRQRRVHERCGRAPPGPERRGSQPEHDHPRHRQRERRRCARRSAAQGPPPAPLRVRLQGPQRRRGRGLQRLDRVLGPCLPQRLTGQRRDAQHAPRRPAQVVGGQQKTLAALVDNEDAVQGTITNLNVTANALAREDEAAIPALNRLRALGAIETWDCEPNEGPQSEPEEDDPPCFVEPDSLFDGNKFPTLQRGETSRVRAPRSNEPCNNPSNPPDRGSLRAGCGALTGSPYRGR